MALRVLFVCAGNVCRSPAAQLIFARLAAGQDIACASAGITGLTGRGVDGPTALALRDIGIDPSGHRGQRVNAGLVEAADLVLTASADHRAALLRETPSAFRRAFTMREFARLGAGLPALTGTPSAENLAVRIADVAEQRGTVEAPLAGADNIADPFGAGLDVARTCVDSITDAMVGVVVALGLTPATQLPRAVAAAPDTAAG